MTWHPMVVMSWLTLILGSVMSITSNFWLGVWLGLELNTMSFIPLMGFDKETNSEASVKYFLIQSLASFSVLIGALFLQWETVVSYSIIMLALSTKMGSIPIFMWFPLIAEMVSIKMNILLMTIQKLAPLVLIFYLNKLVHDQWAILVILALSSLVGAVGGLNEVSLRKIMSYSSMNHLAWMLLGMTLSASQWLVYYVIYCILVPIVFLSIDKIQCYALNLVSEKGSADWVFSFSISLLSLGGLPPLLGFFPKLMVISLASGFYGLSLVLLVLVSSTITLFYYIRLSLVLFTKFSSLHDFSVKRSKPKVLSVATLANFFSLPALYSIILM